MLAASGKTATDHLVSMVSKKDCALWRVFRGRTICKEREGDKDPYDVDYTEPYRSVSEDGVQYAPPLRAAADAPAASWDAAAYKNAQAPAAPAEPVTAVADAAPEPAPPAAAPAAPKPKKAKAARSRSLHEVRRRLLPEQEGLEIVERLEAHGVARLGRRRAHVRQQEGVVQPVVALVDLGLAVEHVDARPPAGRS